MMDTLPLPDMPDMELLSAWDAAGIPPGPGEDFTGYRQRLKIRKDAADELDRTLAEHGEATVFDSVRVAEKERIPANILQEAAEITEPLYGFAFRKFPGFFISENVGLLWGGCLISDTESPLSVFFIRSSFRNSRRFFIYQRQELLAHELCHAARHELADWNMDEFFAYQTSPSRLRRYLGNCFIRQTDALGFILPAMLLLLAQLAQSFWKPHFPVWPFWLLTAGVLFYLLLRNQFGRRQFFRAEKNLRQAGFAAARQILFRATAEERRMLAKLKKPEALKQFLAGRSGELRWQVTLYRFGDNPPKKLSKIC